MDPDLVRSMVIARGEIDRGTLNFDRIYKLPRVWRYFNISALWIAYYPLVIRIFHRLRIRHEVATLLSIACGLAAATIVAADRTVSGLMLAASLAHLKDVFDATDGALARLTGTGHRLGRFLDTIGDGIVFTAWIVAAALVGLQVGESWTAMSIWGTATWLSLFLQCSYFNFHQLHYARLARVPVVSRLDERQSDGRAIDTVLTRVMASIYDSWFGWQDRLVTWFDRTQRKWLGLRPDSTDPRNDGWYANRRFMVANSALCFGTHAFVFILCILAGRPTWFFTAVALLMNAYWAAIIISRLLSFREVT